MSNENEYKDFNYFHIIKPFYYFIAPDLPPSSQLLFLAIVFKFNECFWAGSVRITTAELSKLTGIHYNSIPRSRQTLLQYRFEDDPIIVCTDPRQNSVPFYTINKKLFLELYNRIPKKQNDSIIETGMEDYVVDLEKEIPQIASLFPHNASLF